MAASHELLPIAVAAAILGGPGAGTPAPAASGPGTAAPPQPALAAPFVSNERILSLLQSAQEQLAEEIGPQGARHWQHANRLLARIAGTLEGRPGPTPHDDPTGPAARGG